MKLQFLAKSSSGDSYPIDVLATEGGIRMFCHCPAGLLRQVCKHKVSLIRGDVTMLADPDQSRLLDELKAWSEYPGLKARLSVFEGEIEALEKQKAEVNKQEKAAKARFGSDLVNGVKG